MEGAQLCAGQWWHVYTTAIQGTHEADLGCAQAIRSFNRFELKYLLTSGQTKAFREDLVQHADLDAHAGPAGSYPLASLYYDTADHRFY